MRILRRFLARVKNFAMGQRSREFGLPQIRGRIGQIEESCSPSPSPRQSQRTNKPVGLPIV
jgi:hypothetical protein